MFKVEKEDIVKDAHHLQAMGGVTSENHQARILMANLF